MNEVNEIDEIITKGMLLAEKSIRFHRSNHPWSPTLTKAILDVQFWKTKISIVLNKKLRKKEKIEKNGRQDHVHTPCSLEFPSYIPFLYQNVVKNSLYDRRYSLVQL